MIARPEIKLLKSRWVALFALLVVTSLFAACGSEDTGDGEYYYLAGTVEGLQGEGLILQNNGDHDLSVDEDGEFWFDVTFPDGHEYDVTVLAVPAQQNCHVNNGSGVIDGANVVDLDVQCSEASSNDPAHFSVSIDAGQSTLNVQDGDLVTIVATIENTGDRSDVQDVTLRVDGELADTHSNVDLSGGQSETVTLEWQSEPGEFGTYNAVVASGDASDSATINVGPESGSPYFRLLVNEDVSDLDVIEGEAVRVRTTVHNIGDVQGEQDVTLSMDGQVVATRTVDLVAGNTDSFFLEWFTGDGDAGSYTAQVATADDSVTMDVNVEIPPDPPFFEVAIDTDTSVVAVEVEETLFIDVFVENTGEVTDTQDLVLTIGDDIELVESDLTLGESESQTVTFEWETTAADIGNHQAHVSSNDTSDSVPVVVYPLPGTAFFDVAIDDEDSDLVVEHGEPVTVVVDIENLGDTADTQDLVLEIDGVEEDSVTDVEIVGGETSTATLEWQTEEGDAGFYTATVYSDDSSASATITVIDPNVISVTGHVIDAQGLESLEGVEVVLIDVDTGEEAASTTLDADGFYWVEVQEPGDYQLILSAPGLEPNYEVAQVADGNEIILSLQPGPALQDMTIDWKRATDLVFQGGVFDLQHEPGQQGSVSFNVPGCTEQPNGTWESDGGDGGATFDPEERCFQIKDVAIDLLTGALDLDVDDIDFPNVVIEPGGDGGGGDFDFDFDLIMVEELELHWHFDAIAGVVDFTDGSMNIDLELRILLGGTASAMGGFFGEDVDFGARAGEMDCQLTGAWGGDIEEPQPDTDGVQVGDYLHDPIQMQLTTGPTGPLGAEGTLFDAATRTWVVADNAMTIGAMSEDSNPGGSACGEIDIMGMVEDITPEINGLLGLPGSGGSFLGEFEVLMP